MTGPQSALEMDISIHALREESDIPESEYLKGLNISIHALREESDRSSSLRDKESS